MKKLINLLFHVLTAGHQAQVSVCSHGFILSSFAGLGLGLGLLESGLPRWHSGKESTCRCRRCKRHRFDP